MQNIFPFGPEIPDKLSRIVQKKHYSSGTILFRAEEVASQFYHILSGRVQIFYLMENSWVHTIRFYKSGDIMGDLELFHPGKYGCFSQAVNDVTCLEIPLESLRNYMDGQPALLWEMGRSIAVKLEKTGMIQAARMRYPLRNRLASYFLMMDQFQEADAAYQELHTDSLIELAALIGCSYRHLTRTLKEMEQEGLLKRGKGRLVLLDRPGLNLLAAEME